MGGPGKLATGMDVLSSDGEKLGRVKSVSPDGQYFRVDCPFAPDYYVPVQDIASADDGRVHLRVSKTAAANQGWEARPEGA